MYNFGYIVSRACFWIWLKCLHSLKVYGSENIPMKGPFILVSNHVSFGDPPIIGASCLRPIHFMAKKELFESSRWGWWFHWLHCIPISRDKKDYRATKESLRLLREGRAIGLFPEGQRSETGELQKAELGAGFIAVKSGAPVVPLYIYGTNYTLPKDGKYTLRTPVSVYIGKPFKVAKDATITDKRQMYQKASDEIMDSIRILRDSMINKIKG